MATSSCPAHRAKAVSSTFFMPEIQRQIQQLYGAAYCPTITELKKAKKNSRTMRILRSMCFYTRGLEYKLWKRMDLYYRTRQAWKQRGGKYESNKEIPPGEVHLTLEMLCPDVAGYYEALEFLRKNRQPKDPQERVRFWGHIQKIINKRLEPAELNYKWATPFMRSFYGDPEHGPIMDGRKYIVCPRTLLERELVPVAMRGQGKLARDVLEWRTPDSSVVIWHLAMMYCSHRWA
jgi:hypothetical protein